MITLTNKQIARILTEHGVKYMLDNGKIYGCMDAYDTITKKWLVEKTELTNSTVAEMRFYLMY